MATIAGAAKPAANVAKPICIAPLRKVGICSYVAKGMVLSRADGQAQADVFNIHSCCHDAMKF
jgi:tRNA-binding EMAP/Myf-like protein